MNQAQAIDRLIANKQQRTPFQQTEYVGQQKQRDPEAARAAQRAWEDSMIEMAAGGCQNRQQDCASMLWCSARKQCLRTVARVAK